MPDGTPSLGLRGHRREQLVTSGYEAQRFDLRFFRPFRADLSIRKSSSFFLPLIAATSHLGLAPRPAQVSPEWFRYFGGTFLPFNALPPPRTTLRPPTTPILSNCISKLGPTPVKHFVNPLSQVHECLNVHP